MRGRRYEIRITEDQYRKLSSRASEFGFVSMSDYIRFVIFMEIDFGEKLDAVYNKIVGENK